MAGETKKMTRNTLILMPAKVLEGVLLLVMSALYSRMFPTEINGEYQTVNTTVLVMFLITSAWLYNASARFVSEYRSKEREKKFYSTFMLAFGVITVGVVALGGLVWRITGNFLFFAGSLMLTTYSLFTIMNGLLIQTEHIMISIMVSLLDVAGKIACAAALVAVQGGGTPYPAVFGAVISDLVASGIAMAVLHVPQNTRVRHFSKPLLSDLLTFGVPLIGMSIGTGLLTMIDRYIVRFMEGSSGFAVYMTNYAVSSGIFGMIAAAVVRATYPSLISGYANDGQAAAEHLLGQGTRLYFLIGMPAAFGLCAVCQPLSHFMFEEQYWPGAGIIGIAAMAYFFMDLTEYAIKGFELTKNTKPVLGYSLLAAAVKIAATFGLTYLLGIQGAAWGTLLAFVLYFVIVVVGMRSTFRFRPDPKSTARIFISALLCAVSAWLVCRFLPLGDSGGAAFIKTLAGVAVGGVVYLVCIVVSGEMKPEVEMVRQALANRKKAAP